MRLQLHFPSGPRIVALDVACAAWTVAWVVLGFVVAAQVHGLATLSDTVSGVGGAIEQSGQTLQSLESLPLVGSKVRGPAGSIERAGRSAVVSGRSSRRDIERLSTLLGVVVAIVPSVPLLALYLPLRLAQVRDSRRGARQPQP